MRYDSEKKLWIYIHKKQKIDYASWQPSEPGQSRNDLARNSWMPRNADGSVHDMAEKWLNSEHKEQLSSIRNQEEEKTTVVEETKERPLSLERQESWAS